VEVSAVGWRVVPTCDVRFLRPKGFLPLPIPVPASRSLFELLMSFLNVRDERDLKLITGWLVAALRGRPSFTILNINGEQGSAKSTACRNLRSIIDPNKADAEFAPKDQRDLMISAYNRFIVSYDNFSRIEPWLSDALCSLTTGMGFRIRTLHTDRDETIIQACRPLLVNGINDVVTRPDLQERTITVTLQPIRDGARRTAKQVNAAFDAALPGVLAGLLDAVAGALKNEPFTHITALPRMADFVETVTAAEESLGWAPGSFLTTYNESRKDAVEQMLDSDAVVKGIRMLTLPWAGTPDQLRMELAVLVNSGGDEFPKTAAAMGTTMRTIAPLLRQVGIDVVFEKKRTRLIHLRRIPMVNTAVDIHTSGRSLPVGNAGAPEPVEQTQVGCVGVTAASALPLLNTELGMVTH
jgi:hypothetical protein